MEQWEDLNYIYKGSSNIKNALYNKKTGVLVVTFYRGGTYKYEGVSPQEIQQWGRSSSAGQYFAENFKYKKSYSRIG